MSSARRCSVCDYYWPPSNVYHRCPSCDTPTAVMNSFNIEPMSEEAAESLVRHIKFEKYVDSETDEAREARHERWYEDDEEEAENNRKRFEEVMAGAGFAEWELQRFAELEEQLPAAHQKPHSS